MPLSHEQFVSSALELRVKNLEFFKRYYPGIFSFFANYQLQTSKLDLQPEKSEFDLIENGRHVYGGGLAYAPKEVEQFLSVFDYGNVIRSIRPLSQGDYKNPRYFAQKVDDVYAASPIMPDNFKGYQIPEFLPMVVFMGVGLGKHIETLLKARDLRHVLVFENNMDRFMASLYVTDWEPLILPFISSSSRSFRFVLEPQPQSEQISRNLLWNNLIEFCPMFPVMSLFYNHLGSRSFDNIINAINSDLYVHLFSFGNYDDEINQLNNAIHNFLGGVKRLPLPSKHGFDLPVCVVGSGPSLDERIDWLRENQDKVIIISCGTALRALYTQGVVPDFQIELESDYSTFVTQNLNEDKELLRSIKLIGAAQLNPMMFSLFDEARVFFKAEGFLQGLFSQEGEAIKDAAPTCTNAGIAFAIHFGFKDIFLFGLDYGFPNKESHHSKGALYYKEDGPETIKESVDYNQDELMEVEAAAGGYIQTTTFLYASKRRTENIISVVRDSALYNCSKGSKIESTTYLDSQKEFEGKLSAGNDKKSVIDFLFNADALGINKKVIEEKTELIRQHLVTVVEQITSVLDKSLINVSELTDACYQINQILEANLKSQNEHVYYFIRGSIWHFLHAGFSHSVALASSEELTAFIKAWRTQFLNFLSGLETHYCSIVMKEYDIETDKLVSRPISSREEDPPEYVVPNFSEMEWRLTGLVIDESGRYSSLSN